MINKKINFGTDGIRGNADQFPFTDDALISLGMAISKWSITKYKKNNPKVLIGHDTRLSCTRIKKSLISGLLINNLEIFDGKTIPTPAVCQIISKNLNPKFDFGIVISASHNPYYDNGIKIFDSLNNKITAQDEIDIIKLFEEITQNTQNINLQEKTCVNYADYSEQALSEYKNNIYKLFKPNFLKNISIVLDCANGATSGIATEIFQNFGANIITISANPNGTNINENCGALHTKNLQKEVVKNNAIVGFAFDGDGDRLIVVNRYGQTQDGDNILALLLTNPAIEKTEKVVGTIMTNHGFEIYLNQKNKSLIRTAVGDKYIASKLQEENLILGGENSGHIIIKDYMNSGDGIFTALKSIETMLLTNNFEISMFKKTPQILINISVLNKKDLSLPPYSEIIENEKKLLLNGRVIVRYSGTENLLRVMVEDTQEENAKNIASKLASKLQDSLNS